MATNPLEELTSTESSASPRGFAGRMSGLVLAALVLAVLLGSRSSAQQAGSPFKVIVHPSAPVLSLTQQEASDLFLKKTSTWKADGSRAHPVTLADRDLSSSFARAVHRRNDVAIRKYWQRQVFTGRGTPPPELSTVEEMLRYVSSTAGAIGYVPAGTKLSGKGVREIEILSDSGD